MADIDRIKGVRKVLQKTIQLRNEMKKNEDVVVYVGYTASYALAVHENVAMKWKGLPRDHRLWRTRSDGRIREKKTGRFSKAGKRGLYWDPQGKAQAKFLEEPARRLRKEIVKIIQTIYAKTRNLEKALVAGGLRLQRESQQLVPVDTGNLKNSAFTRVERGSRAKQLLGLRPLSISSSTRVASAGKTSRYRKKK